MKRAKKHPPPGSKPRNPVARSPLLRKGGPHEKSRSAKRAQQKRALERQLRDEQDHG